MYVIKGDKNTSRVSGLGQNVNSGVFPGAVYVTCEIFETLHNDE